MIDFERFEVLTFDCYGTLINWEKGILDALRPILVDHGVITSDGQILQLYAEAEAELEGRAYQPYRTILRHVVGRFGDLLGFTPSLPELNVLADSIETWPPFDDTVPSLRALKKRYRLAIISNIDDDLFAGSNRLLQIEFDHIITAAQVKAYKPSKDVFHYAIDRIGVGQKKILHVAQSLYHDHVPAKALGFTTVWINRRHDTEGSDTTGTGATPEAEATPDLTVPDLVSLVIAAGLG
jgi:2-haloacid dehalogenase